MPLDGPGARRTQQQRRDRTGAALLAATAELVVESGVRSVTLARVGERAGYSRGIVTHHFGSKRALLDALARATQSGFVPGLGGLPPGLDHLLRFVEGYVRALGHVGAQGRAFLHLWADAPTTPELAELFRERDEAVRADLRADVAAGLAQGTVRSGVDPADVAVAVLGQLRGIGLQLLLDATVADPERLARAVADQWRRVLAVAGHTCDAGSK